MTMVPVYLERCSLGSLAQVLWSLWRRGVVPSRSRPLCVRCCSGSPAGEFALRCLARLGCLTAAGFEYRFEELCNREGDSLYMLLDPHILKVSQDIRDSSFAVDPLVQSLGHRFDLGRLWLYLEKSAGVLVVPLLRRIHAVSWDHRTRGDGEETPYFFTPRLPWRRALESYAASQGVALGWYRSISIRVPWRQIVALLRRVARAVPRSRGGQRPSSQTSAETGSKETMSVAVPYTGKGLSLDLSRNSDLFWQPFASLKPGQLLVIFRDARDPLDRAKLEQLRSASIRAVAVSPSFSGSPELPSWHPTISYSAFFREARRMRGFLVHSLTRGLWTASGRWLVATLCRFIAQSLSWREFFARFNVRIYVDHNDWDRHRLAADQAIADLGGISVAYQRSDEAFPSVFRASSVDVHFAFSSASAESERQSRSTIRDFVGTGYTHDHAFSRVLPRSAALRRTLEERGARFIVCFFDQGSYDDPTRGHSHAFQAENYRFLLEKLLADPTLGLICKPKKPKLLSRRLGPLAVRLDEAIATGRCVVFEGGAVATSSLPCEASQAADVAIGVLAATVALESALAGTPTLLLDREGVRNHPLYSSGLRSTIFSGWEPLWACLERYRQDPASVPGFGSWTPVLEEKDPFRDGRSAERIGAYIGWLADGLGKGRSREQAMEDARERYARVWGADNVIDLRSGAVRRPHHRETGAMPCEADRTLPMAVG